MSDDDFVVLVVNSLRNTEGNFRGGKVGDCLEYWCLFSKNKWLRDLLEGRFLVFREHPRRRCALRPLVLARSDQQALDVALTDFVRCGIIELVLDVELYNSFLSNVFPVLKKDGITARVILNLRVLNTFIDHVHFKMDSMKDVVPLITPDCWFASIDFMNAYFSVPVTAADRRWLRFCWKGQVYQYTCLPQGLTSAPRLFTKLLEPILSHLRSVGITIIVYIDDCLFIANTEQELKDHVIYACEVFDRLGLTINVVKSSFSPSHVIEFLGCILDSADMSVCLSRERKDKIASLGTRLLSQSSVCVRDLASFIGCLVAADNCVHLAPLRYKYLEIVRNVCLREHKGNYDSFLALDGHARDLVSWWVDNVHSLKRSLATVPPQFVLTTDASLLGWGAVFGSSQTGGHWGFSELAHINVLELKAVLLGLGALCSAVRDSHIRLVTDNTTVVACIEKGGSMKSHLMSLTESIFSWAFERGISLSAEHLSGVENVVADRLSRDDSFSKEWRLLPSLFDGLCHLFGSPRVDLFATRLNFHVQKFVSWKPDPLAWKVDAFSFCWDPEILHYAFPPFSLVGKVLRKVELDGSLLVLVAPMWATQVWFPKMLHLLADVPVVLPSACLTLPQDPRAVHPMGDRLGLAGMLISGDPSRRKEFRRGLETFCVPPGRKGRRYSTEGTSIGGLTFVSQGQLIRFVRL